MDDSGGGQAGRLFPTDRLEMDCASATGRRTARPLEQSILAKRAELGKGPHSIAFALGVAAPTVHAVLRRHGQSRLVVREQPQPAIRYERDQPRELVHVDVRKLGRIVQPGHPVTGDRSRLAHAAIYPDETATSAPAPTGRRPTSSRLLQPHHARTLGLHLQLPQRERPHRPAAPGTRLLQSLPSPSRPRRTHATPARQPCPWDIQLARLSVGRKRPATLKP